MHSVKPTENVRTLFSGHFYRMISPEDEDFVISPCAVLKLLVAVSLGASNSLSDEILWDLYIKQIDEERVRELAREADIFDMGFTLEIREKLELELSDHIDRDTLLNFFQYDFNDLGDKVTIQNFIVADNSLQFKENYRDCMKKSFHTTLVHRNRPEELTSVFEDFPDLHSDKSLDIFGSINLNLTFDDPFKQLSDGSFEALGSFKFNEIGNENSIYFHTKVLEIPLKSNTNSGLSMLMFLPNEFYTLLKQSIGRDYMDLNKIASRLEEKVVEVRLPKIQFEYTTDLKNFFGNISRRGLRKLFNHPVQLEEMFENATESEQVFGKYYQRTRLELTAPELDLTRKTITSLKPEAVFDARNKSFLYVIRTNEMIYAIGHYSKDD